MMKIKKYISYFKIANNLRENISNSSKRRNNSKFPFFFKKVKNYLLNMLAFTCPVNSWRVQFHRWRGVNIGKSVFIGLRCTLDHAYPEYIYLEDNAALSGNDYILCHSNPQEHFSHVLESFVAPVVIKKGTWITINVTVLPGVTIGENCVIGAGATISKNIKDKTIVTQSKKSLISTHYE